MRLTREQAAIIGIFTGICCGPFEDIQKLADELVGYPTLTHMFGDREFADELKKLVRPKFDEICATR